MTACACALSIALTGCQIGNKDIVVSGTLSSRQVFTLDKSACSLKEAKVYLANYQNIYGTAYTIDLWQHDFGDASLLDYVKDITLEELTRVYTMDLLAQSQEVTLSEDETAKVAEAAKEYYASLSEDDDCLYGCRRDGYCGVLYALCAGAEAVSFTDERCQRGGQRR